VFLNEKNEADGNLYVGMPNQFQGFFTGDNKQWLDLMAWRDAHGWDKNGALADVQIDFDADRLELTMNGGQPLPKVNVFNQIAGDMLGNAGGETRTPGPIAEPGAKRLWPVDPRGM